MAKSVQKPAKAETPPAARPAALTPWQPFENLREEIDQLFDDFGRGIWRLPFTRSVAEGKAPALGRWAAAPAVDVAETDDHYELTAELPGLDEKDVEVSLANQSLVIRGEKREETEEKRKDFHLSERRYGSFERRFRLPENVDPNKIEARFKKGVLSVVLPKKAEAKGSAKKIKINSD